jgi:hypothetical protein
LAWADRPSSCNLHNNRSRLDLDPVSAGDRTADSVERLMGTKAEARFAFISDKAEFASDDLLDV